MITFSVLIIIILILIGIRLYDRSHEPVETVTSRATKTAVEAYQNFNIPFIGKKMESGLQVGEWLIDKERKPVVSPEFKEWLNTLSVGELKAFENALARFCASRAFNLGWLLSDDINQDKEMQAALEIAVINYSQAYWQTATAQKSIAAFSTYQTWKSNPQKSGNKPFGQHLFNLLLQKGLATAPPELFLAKEKERDAYVNKAILEVASANPVAFNAAVKEVAAAPQEPEAKEDQILPASA